MTFAVERNSPTWTAAWEGLGRLLVSAGIGDGSDLAQPNDGEVWQLLSSYHDGEELIHEFRHRCHPVTMAREYLDVRTTGETQ